MKNMREKRVYSCFEEDGGRPAGIGIQVLVSNRPKRLKIKALVVSVGGKGRKKIGHVSAVELNGSEHPMTCRKA